MYLFLLKKYCYRGSNYLFLHYSMAQSIKIMFAIAIFITHALQGYVPVDIIWNTYLDQKIQKRKIFWEYVCRTIITLSTCKFLDWTCFLILHLKLITQRLWNMIQPLHLYIMHSLFLLSQFYIYISLHLSIVIKLTITVFAPSLFHLFWYFST